MKILIIGTWRENRIPQFKKKAEEIGKLLAKRKHILITGGGTGISKLVVNSYKKNKGKRYIAYFPSKKEMKRVGEKIGPKPDQIIQTNRDYPERNILMVKDCDGIIALCGGLGTLTEVIHAVKDYSKKVSVINQGEFAFWVKSISELKEKVLLTSDIKQAVINLER